ncbi:hypothetical protein FVB9288_02389 [Flavobacterium sp. CECT 9288]|uniref:IPT/TIG domain-containing protein n=1 Tax=Flavobacterium sp. CECT 9288 TaxID=2845819 RepID=UPI001E61958E|nr:IPT/TIG domain-containing protein [Flavobacterium sp. CECT 9288]CAH0336678.1 hypothetical protein FVB9288_02389 [Flavobacterium sp. CECT 9288]
MTTLARTFSIIFILISTILISCSSEETKYIPPTLVNFPESGLLGQPIVIEIKNFEIGKLQVFFDLEEAQVNYVSDKEIMVIVPRTIKTNTPILKVIDLNENKTILNQTFSLKKPTISKYSSDKITFNETFTIYGENFDLLKDFITVSVNNEKAIIKNVDYNKIEIEIPNKIKTANLEIKVTAQLQEVASTLPLLLDSPMISGINNSSTWLGGQLIVFGENFNPNLDFGEVFINDIPCYFIASNNKLSIDVPPGPHKDFKITNVKYKTAGLTTTFDCDVPILNDVIMVDYLKDINIQHSVIVYNNKAYQFKFKNKASYDFNFNYSLLEFSPTTEKWTELSSFSYTGYLSKIAFDGKKTVYLYKKSTAGNYSLSKFDLSTMVETPISLPFGNKIDNPILFAYQNNFYFIGGVVHNNGTSTVIKQKHQYSESTNSWKTLPASTFSTFPSCDTSGCGECKYFFVGNDIYITIFTGNYKSYKINPNLDVIANIPYALLFEYSNKIFGLRPNSNNELYNVNTNGYKILDYTSVLAYGSSFFTVNNEIYFTRNSWTVYHQNTLFTQKLRKEILNGL